MKGDGTSPSPQTPIHMFTDKKEENGFHFVLLSQPWNLGGSTSLLISPFCLNLLRRRSYRFPLFSVWPVPLWDLLTTMVRLDLRSEFNIYTQEGTPPQWMFLRPLQQSSDERWSHLSRNLRYVEDRRTVPFFSFFSSPDQNQLIICMVFNLQHNPRPFIFSDSVLNMNVPQETELRSYLSLYRSPSVKQTTDLTTLLTKDAPPSLPTVNHTDLDLFVMVLKVTSPLNTHHGTPTTSTLQVSVVASVTSPAYSMTSSGLTSSVGPVPTPTKSRSIPQEDTWVSSKDKTQERVSGPYHGR